MTDQTISEVNYQQVGGSHYAADYAHWDWAEDTGIGAMEYAATKYVCRWKKKEGLQGLLKARHYIEKLKELYQKGRRNRAFNRSLELTQKFVEQGGHGDREQKIFTLCLTWETYNDLILIQSCIQDLIIEAEQWTNTNNGCL